MAINPRTLAIEDALQAFLDTILDRQIRSIVQAWALAWDQTEAALEAAMMELAQATQTGRVTRTQVIRSQRAQAAMEQLGAALEQAAARTGTVITADLAAVIEQAVGAEVGMIESQLTGTRRAELRANLVRADPGQISAMIERAAQQITATTLPLAPETYAAVRAELLRGISVGENPRQAARRMGGDAEDRTNFGLSRAMTIARTEILDAARQAQFWADQDNTEVLAGWVWTAHLDPRTCRSCIAQHGWVHDVDEPGPLDHQNGRCARVPKTKSWEELGFEGIKDPPDNIPDAERWFVNLTEAQQRSILTDRGYDAWRRGEYSVQDWSARRTVDGWRDSYGVSRPPQEQGRIREG